MHTYSIAVVHVFIAFIFSLCSINNKCIGTQYALLCSVLLILLKHQYRYHTCAYPVTPSIINLKLCVEGNPHVFVTLQPPVYEGNRIRVYCVYVHTQNTHNKFCHIHLLWIYHIKGAVSEGYHFSPTSISTWEEA